MNENKRKSKDRSCESSGMHCGYIHVDQIRLHIEALIDPYLESLGAGAPTPAARENARDLLLVPVMKMLTESADSEGFHAPQSIVLLASACEYWSKALHNAAFAEFTGADN